MSIKTAPQMVTKQCYQGDNPSHLEERVVYKHSGAALSSIFSPHPRRRTILKKNRRWHIRKYSTTYLGNICEAPRKWDTSFCFGLADIT